MNGQRGEGLGTLEVCFDCVWAGVSGTEDPYGELEEEFLARWEKAGAIEVDPVMNEHGEIEDGFSWLPCEHCGDTLGGSRFTVVAYRLKTGGKA